MLEQKYKDVATKLSICTFDIKLPISNNSLNFVNNCFEWSYYIIIYYMNIISLNLTEKWF